MTLRVVFMGTPAFALPALRALCDSVHRVVAVYCQPPRPAGRGHQVHRAPTHDFALERGIPVFHPTSLRTPEAQAEFRNLQADVAVVAAYGLILPQAILDAPRLGCVNIHGSLLPRWRGAAPIHRAILAGDIQTGITMMQMDAGLDTGAMLVLQAVPIGPAATTATLHDTLADLGGHLVVSTIEGLDAGILTTQAQPTEGITYAHKILKEESRLDFSKPADQLEREVRAFCPFPGSWFEISGDRIKVLAARVVPHEGVPGTLSVGDGRLVIACGTGGLSLEYLQKSGGKPLDVESFLRGHALPHGHRVS